MKMEQIWRRGALATSDGETARLFLCDLPNEDDDECNLICTAGMEFHHDE